MPCEQRMFYVCHSMAVPTYTFAAKYKNYHVEEISLDDIRQNNP